MSTGPDLTLIKSRPRFLQSLLVACDFARNFVQLQMVDTWLTEFRIDRIRVVLQKGYVLYV